MTDWQIWLLLTVIFVINNRVAIWGYKRNQRHRHVKFMRAVQVEYPDAKLAFIAVDTSDEVAMARLEREIRENRYTVRIRD